MNVRRYGAGGCLGVALLVFDEASELSGPYGGMLENPSPRQEDEGALGFRRFDDFQPDAIGGCGMGDALTGIALVDIGDVDIVSIDCLHNAGELFDLATIFGVGGCHVKREQITQYVYRLVKLRPLLALTAVIASALPALGRGAQRSVIDGSLRSDRPIAPQQDVHGPLIIYQRFKATRRQPALGLLIHCGPRR